MRIQVGTFSFSDTDPYLTGQTSPRLGLVPATNELPLGENDQNGEELQVLVVVEVMAEPGAFTTGGLLLSVGATQPRVALIMIGAGAIGMATV